MSGCKFSKLDCNSPTICPFKIYWVYLIKYNAEKKWKMNSLVGFSTVACTWESLDMAFTSSMMLSMSSLSFCVQHKIDTSLFVILLSYSCKKWDSPLSLNFFKLIEVTYISRIFTACRNFCSASLFLLFALSPCSSVMRWLR